MKNLKSFTSLNNAELSSINGGFETAPITIGFPPIIPFGDPQEWDVHFPELG